MARSAQTTAVYLEIGQKRTVAGVIAWPGWCRVGRDESSALQALVEYAPRYHRVLDTASIAFDPPADVSALNVVERLTGSGGTDFGIPEHAPSSDSQPVDQVALQRLITILQACWRSFDAGVAAAAGKELRKGPRGGGRELDAIARHVLGGEQGYVARLGWKFKREETGDLDADLRHTRQAALDALAASTGGELPTRGPRGGAIWTPRYFVRRAAWHVLDHLWEIEDRVM